MKSMWISKFFCYRPDTNEINPILDSHTEIDAIIKIAENNKLLPLLYIVLKRIGGDRYVPLKSIEYLELSFVKAQQAFIRKSEELKNISDEFNSKGLDFILLKEYAFDNTFPKPGCIHQNDFDILIHPKDLKHVSDMLNQKGFYRVPRPWDNEYRYKCDGKTPIDLHISYNPQHGLWANQNIDIEKIFDRSNNILLGEVSISVLNPVDGALFLLIHTAIHHHYVPFSKIVACWNYLVNHQDQIDQDELYQKLLGVGLAHLGWFAIRYLEQITGYSITHFHTYPEPALIEKKFFKQLIAKPEEYFNGDGKAKQKKKHFQDNTHLLCYPNSWKGKLSCLKDIYENIKL